MNKVVRSMLNLFFILGIPLAWRQLVADKKRFAAAIVGVTFGVTLMMYQLGLHSALHEKVVFPHRSLNGDLVMVSRNFNFFYSTRNFTRHRLMQALAVKGVRSAAPLYLAKMNWQTPHTHELKEIFVFGIDPDNNPFDNQGIRDGVDTIKKSNTLLYDLKAARDYGPVKQMFDEGGGSVAGELNGKRVNIEGFFSLGVIFQPAANLVVSDETFFGIQNMPPHDMINIGVIKTEAGSNPEAVAELIEKSLPDDVQVITKKHFIENEQSYWSNRTPIGFVITAGMLVAMIVGSVIVYQILYTDVNDHLDEYATLMAIGVKDAFFFKLVIQEALYLLLIGFVPGLTLTAGLYALTRFKAYMPVYMTLGRTSFIFILTFIMCMIAGALATKRLRSANPADVF